jgi:hypothetical protein
VLAAPSDLLVITQGEKRVKPLGKELVVVVEGQPEERERLGERSTARHDLGPTLGKQIQGGKVLKHPDRIGGTQDGHGAGEANIRRPRCGSRQDHGRTRRREVLSMVLAEPIDVETDLIGQHDFLDDLFDTLRRTDRPVRHGVCEDFGEGVDA